MAARGHAISYIKLKGVGDSLFTHTQCTMDSKIIFVDFIFLILNSLEFNFIIKLNHVGKAL
jgi:hypothetical protein